MIQGVPSWSILLLFARLTFVFLLGLIRLLYMVPSHSCLDVQYLLFRTPIDYLHNPNKKASFIVPTGKIRKMAHVSECCM